MALDLRQVMAAFLTFSMFVMLGNMIKKDHIDPFLEPYSVSPIQYSTIRITKPRISKLIEISNGLWMERNEPAKPCWKKPSSRNVQSNGYIFFSLTHGPEFHASQIANAVFVARHLGATLAIPDIKGTKLGGKRNFGEIYDLDQFMTSLDGVVQVGKNPPAALSNGRLPIVRVPNRVSKDFIASKIKPVFQRKQSLKIVTYYSNASKITMGKVNKVSNVYQCMAMYESLKLQADLRELVDSMVGTLRSVSQKMQGRFVAVDLRVDMLEKRSCRKTDAASKQCYNAEEIGEFLKKIGFHKDTTIYITQTGWHNHLNGLRNVFPNTFTKDAIMPADQKAKFTDSESREYEKYVDFYMCAKGDVLVPAFPSRFYASVVGKRIAHGNTEIFLPAKNVSANATEYISPYIAKRTHFAYSCFC